MNIYSKIILTTFALFCALAHIPSVYAAEFSVTPLIIDIESEARDASTHTITVVNHDSRPTRLYASVHEITVGENSEIKSFVPASMSDRSTSVTSWLEISRGRIDLPPGTSKELPLVIRINHDTPQGTYHAFVGFASGGNRDEAELATQKGQGQGVVLRIVVGSKKQEFLKLESFSTDRFSIKEGKGTISYTLSNTGDVPLTPQGDIIIYDTRGKELTSIDLSEEDPLVIQPGAEVTYTENIPFLNRLGKHKAYLSIEYGSEQKAALYDTSFYYSIPWFYLIVVVILLIVIITSLVLLQRRNMQYDVYETEPEAYDVPLQVGKVREHSEYDHDINLKKKDN